MHDKASNPRLQVRPDGGIGDYCALEPPGALTDFLVRADLMS